MNRKPRGYAPNVPGSEKPRRTGIEMRQYTGFSTAITRGKRLQALSAASPLETNTVAFMYRCTMYLLKTLHELHIKKRLQNLMFFSSHTPTPRPRPSPEAVGASSRESPQQTGRPSRSENEENRVENHAKMQFRGGKKRGGSCIFYNQSPT